MSAPYDLGCVIKGLQIPGFEVHNKKMTEACQQNVLNNYDYLKEHEEELGYDTDKCLKVSRIEEFDQFYTAPINGYKDVEEFY